MVMYSTCDIIVQVLLAFYIIQLNVHPFTVACGKDKEPNSALYKLYK